MNDATQKLVDKARSATSEAGDARYRVTGDFKVLIDRLRIALEAERDYMQSLAKWVGVDEATPSLEIACEVSTALEAAQRPPVSPEARDGLANEVGYPMSPDDVDEAQSDDYAEGRASGYNDAFENVLASILARYVLPVLDVEKVAAFLCEHVAVGVGKNDQGCKCGEWLRSRDPEWLGEHRASALVAALPTLTREETNE